MQAWKGKQIHRPEVVAAIVRLALIQKEYNCKNLAVNLTEVETRPYKKPKRKRAIFRPLTRWDL